MGRAPCCSKVGLNRGVWTAAEDKLLVDYIAAHGEGRWRSLPKDAGLKRCGKSCRLRWLNYLRPDIKRGNITPEEEDLIIRLHNLLGNRWSLIAGRLPGRTDNEIKNYWNTTLRRKVQGDQNSTRVPGSSAKKKPSGVKPRASKGDHKNSKNASKAVRTKAVRFSKAVMITPSVQPVLDGNDDYALGGNEQQQGLYYWNGSDECGSLSSGDDVTPASSGEDMNAENMTPEDPMAGGGSDQDFWSMLNEWIMDEASQSELMVKEDI